MDLRELRYLVAVADEGSVTAAAAACHVAQPSLSQAVKKLERELGTELLHRVGRGVVLTAAGEVVVASARDLLRGSDAIRDRVAAVRGVLAGRLDLVGLPTLAVDPLAGLVGAFRARHPAVSLRLHQPESPHDLLDLVRAGRCELGLTELGQPSPGLRRIALGHQELLAVLPPDHDMDATTLSLERLADLPLVTSAPGTSTRRLIDEALATIDRVPHVVVECDQREAIAPLVLAGAGVAVLPTGQAAAAAAQGAVVRRFRPRLRRAIGLVHRDAPLSPAAEAFVALVR
jgi:DNA-binding transcriptional LysR family regulator